MFKEAAAFAAVLSIDVGVSFLTAEGVGGSSRKSGLAKQLKYCRCTWKQRIIKEGAGDTGYIRF